MSASLTLIVLGLGEDPARFEDRFLSSNAFSRYTLRYGIQ